MYANILLIFFLATGLTVSPAVAQPAERTTIAVSSPDGKIVTTIAVKERLHPYPDGQRIYYSVQYQGRDILLDSPFGLDLKDIPPIAKDLVLTAEARQAVNETWETVWGNSAVVTDHFSEVRISLQETREPKRQVDLIFRVYNDGVAFRYFLPEQPGLQAFKLTAERSEFHFAGNHEVWAANYGGFVSHQESEFEEKRLNELVPSEVYGLPLLVKVADTTWVAITEANLTDWAGMYLTGAGSFPYALVTTLSPRLDEPGVLVKSQTPRLSPWRVMMIGDRPGDLIESDIVLNLNEPNAIDDVSWIKPGRSAWDRWWSGAYAPDVDFDVGMNTASMKYFTQFAADMGWEYVLVDWWWYGDPFIVDQISHPERDITDVVPELDMPELIRFANERNVDVLVWLEWSHAARQMEEAFPLYEQWGVAGVKVDFMQRDDQEMVNFYRRLVKLAADHHLTVDFHGAYKPTGFRRTYPNLLTREGVLGNEYNKWSDRVTPKHNVTLPFTRMLAGPMDFTPGGFRHIQDSAFVAQDSAPFVMGTRTHQLAMMVVYESPLQVLCDSPYNYRVSPAGLDFLKIVPTTWDESRVVDGLPGAYIIMARRSGDTWYVGAMTDESRVLNISLDFLGRGEYTARIYQDAPDSVDYPDRIEEKVQDVTVTDTLVASLAPGGGYVMRIVPRK